MKKVFTPEWFRANNVREETASVMVNAPVNNPILFGWLMEGEGRDMATKPDYELEMSKMDTLSNKIWSVFSKNSVKELCLVY